MMSAKFLQYSTHLSSGQKSDSICYRAGFQSFAKASAATFNARSRVRGPSDIADIGSFRRATPPSLFVSPPLATTIIASSNSSRFKFECFDMTAI